jgi:rhamnopyranosyl-N-acetylglucosaminyl-diphospho-decaprenol beta-1,3/1,4-galactofuranosyltransferase
MEKIIAVVVSCNSYQQLKKCVQAIRNQSFPPDAIMVVNNGSADYTSVWLDNQLDIIHVYQEHQGTAGGFRNGMEKAYELGYDWIWCMDDDGCPKEDALEKMMDHAVSKDTLYNSVLVDIDDKKSFNWKLLHYKTVDEIETEELDGVCHPFNGAMIHRNIIAKVGLPVSKLFYWGEGSEYFYRATKKHKIPAKTIVTSVHYHPTDRIELKKEWDFKDGWKMYFYIRNRFEVMKSKYNFMPLALLMYWAFIPAFFIATLLYQKKQRTKKLLFVFWPVIDAMCGAYGMTIQKVQRIMELQAQRNLASFFMEPIKKALIQFFVPSMDNLGETYSA